MATARLPALLRSLLTGGHLAAKATRFGFIGVLSGTIYAGVTTALVAGLGMDPVWASLIGYCVSVPASFLGHRQVSFRSQGHWTHEAVRFVVTQGVNMAVTAGAMHAAVAWGHLPYWWGMIGAVVLVPVANFVMMNMWVFRDQPERVAAATNGNGK